MTLSILILSLSLKHPPFSQPSFVLSLCPPFPHLRLLPPLPSFPPSSFLIFCLFLNLYLRELTSYQSNLQSLYSFLSLSRLILATCCFNVLCALFQVTLYDNLSDFFDHFMHSVLHILFSNESRPLIQTK